ncbi:site-specific integrase [Sphingomonas faeni]|uniref:site-specific integrase n=1 Tax=Sphingomonas faeni TaxID=185950 RepID=UPI0020C7AF63|nr:site-specific integrase [Sphingomonas faeni]MCP8890853.1 site-specific integrase [Sphingomonas faeni]
MHIAENAKTGRLSYRRAYPTALLPFIPASSSGKTSAEFKVSLATKDPRSQEFDHRRRAAEARFDAIVAKATKAATGTFDILDAPRLAYLGKVFEIDLLKRDAAALWNEGPARAHRRREGWEEKLGDFQRWQGEGASEAIEDWWSHSAIALLDTEGLVIDPAGDNLGLLCRELNASALRAAPVALAQLNGETVSLPAPPAPVGHKERSAPGTSRLPLLETFDAYTRAAGMTPLTAQDWRRHIVHLKDFLGHDDAAKITTDDLMRWRDELLKDGTRQANTVRGRYLGSIRAMLSWAVSERKLPVNVALNIKVHGKEKPELRSKDFTDDEALRILTASLIPPANRILPTYALSRRWVPWLCAYTGARVNEITQLRGIDVTEEKGIWVIRITPEAGTQKSMKARFVPLHTHLIDQGFLEVVKSSGDGPMFYDPSRQRAPSATNRHIKKVGERLGAWVREEVGITDKGVAPSHGWRHRFKTVARAVHMSGEVRDAIQGHEPRTEGEAYGSMPIPTMAAAIALLPRYAVPGV